MPDDLSPPENPFASPPLAAASGPDLVAAQFASGPVALRPPRVWTVFVALVVAVLLVLVGQVIAGIGLVTWHFANGGTLATLQEEILDLATRPAVVMLISAPGQLAMAGVALGAAWLSPQPLRQRLGLVQPKLPAWACAVAIVGVIVPFAVGLGAAISLPESVPKDPTARLLYEKMTHALAIPFILYIALFPGFSEELLFRGYVQRRLIERWNPWAAVLVTSAVFAVFHIMPHTVAFAFPLGIWLGLLAWRTGSVWPGIVCHAAVNGLWNVRNSGIALGYLPDQTPWPVLAVLGTVGLAAFVWSLRLMFATPADGPLGPTDIRATGVPPGP